MSAYVLEDLSETEEREFDKLPEELVPEFPCQVCGKALEYGGRGRKPKYCDEHKPGNKGGAVKRQASSRNVALASQAADVLMLSNDFLKLIAAMSGMSNTAEAIERANPEFRNRAYEALLTDPELARSITKGGAITGKVALVMAYAMFAMAVAPTGYMEFKMNRAARESLEE